MLTLSSLLTLFTFRLCASTVLIMMFTTTMSSEKMKCWCSFAWSLVRYFNYQILQIASTIILWNARAIKSFQCCYVRTTLAHLKVKQSLLNYVQTLSSGTSTITSTSHNLLNGSVFIVNYLFHVDNNDINEHKNNNKFTLFMPYFSMSSSGSNPMTHNNNVPIKLLDTM